jgi:hypothetical protein
MWIGKKVMFVGVSLLKKTTAELVKNYAFRCEISGHHAFKVNLIARCVYD